MRTGIIGAANIARQRFLPALAKIPEAEFAGVASRSRERAEAVTRVYGGKAYASYEELLGDGTVGLVYIPLPPALHYEWGMKAVEAGKHVLMEKPFTDSLSHTEELLAAAERKGLCVQENYMFLHHSQLRRIREMINGGELGEIRGYTMEFGFPLRPADDFRYRKDLGGGALLDCGGYPVRLALELMGAGARVAYAELGHRDGFEVDMYGNALLAGGDGLCAHVSFGMDNAYRCRLEVWGSRVTLAADRIFTAGPDYAPVLALRSSADERTVELPPDDHFMHAVEHMLDRIRRGDRGEHEMIRKQAELTETIKETDHYHSIQ